MRWRFGIAGLVVVLAASAALWFFENYEFVDGAIYVGYQGEARRDSLLAARRLFQELGFPTQAVTSLADLAALPPRGVLIVSADRWALPAPAQQRVLDWIKQGNGLILEAKPSVISDPLSSTLGIERNFISRTPGSVPPTDSSGEEHSEPPIGSPRRNMDIAGELYSLPWAPEHTYRVVLARWQALSVQGHAVRFTLADDRGAYVVGFSLGEGQVVAFNNFLPLFNWGIGNADNAAFVAQLVEQAGHGGPVVFFRNPVKASLWDWLRSHAAWPMAAAALLAGLWLWRTAVRTGPTLPDPQPARLRWADHIEASGRFLWRRGARAKLAARAREAAFSAIERRIPGFGNLSADVKQAILVRQFGLSPQDAFQVLGPLPVSPAMLAAEARLLRGVYQLSASAAISPMSPP